MSTLLPKMRSNPAPRWSVHNGIPSASDANTLLPASIAGLPRQQCMSHRRSAIIGQRPEQCRLIQDVPFSCRRCNPQTSRVTDQTTLKRQGIAEVKHSVRSRAVVGVSSHDRALDNHRRRQGGCSNKNPTRNAVRSTVLRNCAVGQRNSSSK